MAKWLHVGLPEKVKPKSPTEEFLSEHPKTEMREIGIDNGNTVVGKKIVEIQFPKNAIIAMIKRDDKYITPNGATVIEADDMLIVLSDSKKGIERVYDTLNIRDFEVSKLI